MGQKINPIGFRMGISRDWTAKWYAGTKSYTQNLISDIALRDYLKVGSKRGTEHDRVERPARASISPCTPRGPASSSARRARTSRSCARK
jgi:small subunit ribosomal protein S3